MLRLLGFGALGVSLQTAPATPCEAHKSAAGDIDDTKPGLKQLQAEILKAAACGRQTDLQQPLTAAPRPVSSCPFGHGSVGANPFPGYVHGRHPQICKNGCLPDPALGKYKYEDETPMQALRREAIEYCELYQRERGNSQEVKDARMAQILDEIDKTGTYELTPDELEHGVRVAWRNAPKCANRKFWEDLRLVDRRHCLTPEDMFQGCLDLLEIATLSCATTANIVVFRAQTPGTLDGPRVWNSQIVRYTCYEQPDGTLLGDPSERAFTKMLIEKFGWTPPPLDKRTAFDVLPVLLQAHPDEAPKLFHLPDQYAARVPLSHPQHPAFEKLGLQWYAVPAVSNMEVTVGGLLFTACPFNGWYCTTEIVRNLTDEGRYNLCETVAKTLGISTRSEDSMWKDKVVTEITFAVMHSFREAGMGMVSHHTMIKNFYGWYYKELATRGYCPGNWKWIIPPVSSSQSKCYLQLAHMTEYSLKPGLWYAPGWHNYQKRLPEGVLATIMPAPTAGPAPGCTPNGKQAAGDMVAAAKNRCLIVYASTTGNTAQYAERVAGMLRGGLIVQVLNMEDFEPDSWSEHIKGSELLVVMCSTYGPGAPPSSANKLIAWMQKPEGAAVLKDKPFAVIGFGSSSYPRFCAAADTLQTLLLSAGANSMIDPVKADQKGFEELTVWGGLRSLLAAAVTADIMTPQAEEQVAARLPAEGSGDGTMPVWNPRFAIAVIGRPDGMVVPPDRTREAATVLAVEELMGEIGQQQGRSTKLVRFSFANKGPPRYMPGDEVAVFGANDAAVVEEFGSSAGIQDLDSLFFLQDLHAEDETQNTAPVNYPQLNSFRNVLTNYLSITAPITYEAVCALCRYAPGDQLLSRLARHTAEFRSWEASLSPRFCDLFKLFPGLTGALPPQVLLELLPIIRPRHYSISSSATASEGELHITVSQLRYSLPSGETRDGFCSSFLCSRKKDDIAYVAVVPTPGFRMPLNSNTPIIMVAAGTGIAPFRGFWQERLARIMKSRALAQDTAAAGPQAEVMGPAMVIFGCRSDTWDMLYGDELKHALSQGALSDLLVAYSRQKGVVRTYVQDVVRERKDQLLPLLQHPKCHVFVCGSSDMATEVASAFRKLLGSGPYSELVAQGRYHEDVFGMTVPKGDATKKGDFAAAAASVRLMSQMTPEQLTEKVASGAVDINARDEDASTVLHYAARLGKKELVACLCKLPDISLNAMDLYGRTPLQEAVLAGHTEVADILKAHDAALVPVICARFYKLQAAAMMGDVATLRSLIVDDRHDVNQQDHCSLTALHIAAMRGDAEMIKVLLEHKASMSTQTMKGMLPLQLAMVLKRTAAMEVLKAAGAPLIASTVITGGDGSNAKEAMGGGAAYATQGGDALSAEDRALVQSSWAILSDEAHPFQSNDMLKALGVDLFTSLFDQYPHLIPLFPFKDENNKPNKEKMEEHGLKVLGTLGDIVYKMNNMEALERFVERLIENHMKYGVVQAHYDMVLGLMATLVAQGLGKEGMWDDAMAKAWGKVIGLVIALAAKSYGKLVNAPAAAVSSNGAAH